MGASRGGMAGVDWKRAAIVALAVVAFLAASCGGDDTSALKTQVATLQTQVAQPTATAMPAATPEPDRVVGITWSCIGIFPSGAESPLQGNGCESFYRGGLTSADGRVYIKNLRAVVNVRTATGSAYTAYLDNPEKDIQVGDPWPPK